MTLVGRNFSPEPNQNIITFGYLGTNPNDPPESVRAKVISATTTEVVVEIPEAARSGFIQAAKVGGESAFSTAELTEPFKRFELEPDPVITSIFPPNPRPGTKILIRGTGFSKDLSEIVVNFAEGQFGNVIVAAAATEDGVVVTIPVSFNSNAVTLTIGGRVSNTFAFEAPSLSINDQPAWMWVNGRADVNSRDGELSLREALMLANGTLSLAELTVRPENGGPRDATYESDQVALVPGTAQGNIIRMEIADMTLQSALPPMFNRTSVSGGGTDNNGQLQLTTVIDGMAVDDAGFVFDGVTDSGLSNFTLENFGGPGVLLKGGATQNNISTIQVVNPKSTGVLLETSAFANSVGVAVSEGGGNGVVLSGANVLENTLSVTNFNGGGAPEVGHTRNAGWGIVVENGASYNTIGFSPSDAQWHGWHPRDR